MSKLLKQKNARVANIFLVDDHPITRLGVERLLQGEPDLHICGHALNAAQAMTALRNPMPDLILSDITMEGKGGLEFIRDVKANHPMLPVLVYSVHDENVFAERALRAGASGYIMKREGGEKLLLAIRHVLNGEVFLSDQVSTGILRSLSSGGRTRKGSELSALTDREFAVFHLLSQGLPTQEIGQHLNISAKTVETHRSHIREKLKLRSGAELRKYAMRWGASNTVI